MVSSAKRFLQEKYKKRENTYLEYAATNLKDIEKLLDKYRPADKDEILTSIKKFFASAEKVEALQLELPPMGSELLSSILYNCALYEGNMAQAQKIKESTT